MIDREVEFWEQYREEDGVAMEAVNESGEQIGQLTLKEMLSFLACYRKVLSGLQYEVKNDLHKSKEEYQRATKEYPYNAFAFLSLGYVLDMSHKHDEALDALKQALTTCFSHEARSSPFFCFSQWYECIICNNIGCVMEIQDQEEKALQYFDRCLEIYPRCIHSLANRARMYRRQAKVLKDLMYMQISLDRMQRGLQITHDFEPENFTSEREKEIYQTVTEMMRPKWAAEKNNLQKIIEVNPLLSDAHHELGDLCFFEMDDLNEAEEHYRKAIRVAPHNVYHYCALARLIAVKYDNYHMALEVIKQAGRFCHRRNDLKSLYDDLELLYEEMEQKKIISSKEHTARLEELEQRRTWLTFSYEEDLRNKLFSQVSEPTQPFADLIIVINEQL